MHGWLVFDERTGLLSVEFPGLMQVMRAPLADAASKTAVRATALRDRLTAVFPVVEGAPVDKQMTERKNNCFFALSKASPYLDDKQWRYALAQVPAYFKRHGDGHAKLAERMEVCIDEELPPQLLEAFPQLRPIAGSMKATWVLFPRGLREFMINDRATELRRKIFRREAAGHLRRRNERASKGLSGAEAPRRTGPSRQK